MTDRLAIRCALGVAAVFTEAEAASLLPVRDADARAWLRDRGLITDEPGLGKVVVWSRVLRLLEGGDGPVDRSRVEPARARLPRAALTPRRREP